VAGWDLAGLTREFFRFLPKADPAVAWKSAAVLVGVAAAGWQTAHPGRPEWVSAALVAREPEERKTRAFHPPGNATLTHPS